MPYMNLDQIKKMGFASVGNNVYLSDKASYYNCSNISLGNNVRIDDFCILSAGTGGIYLGNNIHIAANSLLIGAGKIAMHDFSGLSARVSVYSSSDDYSGKYMTNPTVPTAFTNVKHADVTIGKHVIIGSGSVVLPGVTIGDGAAIGALSLVSKNCREFGIYSGMPVRWIKNRKTDLLELEKLYAIDQKKNE